MHLNNPSPFASTTSSPTLSSSLKKRKRDGTASAWDGENNLNLSMERTGFMIHQGQLDCHHDVDHEMDLNVNLSPVPTPAPAPCFLPTTATASTTDLDSRSRLQPMPPKKRRILQPTQQQQQQQQQPWPNTNNNPSRSPSPPNKKPQPPSLLIPPSYSSNDSASLKASPEVSPRTVSPLPPPLLRPCHICHRRPTTRVMLDAYADCELCGERACYICLRECNAVGCGTAGTGITTWSGPTTPDGGGGGGEREEITIKNGYLYARQQPPQEQQGQQEQYGRQHRHRKICSCCAVEGLTETGDEIVWCLECVRGRYPSWE